jgi:serine protease AprX
MDGYGWSYRWRLRRVAGLGLALAAVTGGVVGPAAGGAAAVPGSPDGAGSVWLDSEWGDDDTNESEKASKGNGKWKANRDTGSLHTVATTHGAQHTWKKNDATGRKITGKGVTVALIDTGVSPVEGLDAAGKIINGPDLSLDGQAPNLRHLDGFGHGTHMAGIIAGRDSAVPVAGATGAKNFVGVAPDARVLNMKVATADGATDVSQVIAAIDWVVQHRNDNGMNVRVINVSYGTSSSQSYVLDPLAHAVENAWRAGVVVVAAAGNDGPGQVLTMPAVDPYVIAVGGQRSQGHGEDRRRRFGRVHQRRGRLPAGRPARPGQIAGEPAGVRFLRGHQPPRGTGHR